MRPVLCKLHWLPVRQRLQYKIALLTFKALNSMALSCISDLLTKFDREWELHSTSTNRLNVPAAGNTNYYNDRTFSIAAPIVWNNLPAHLRTMSSFNLFKQELKIHILRSAYWTEAKTALTTKFDSFFFLCGKYELQLFHFYTTMLSKLVF